MDNICAIFWQYKDIVLENVWTISGHVLSIIWTIFEQYLGGHCLYNTIIFENLSRYCQNIDPKLLPNIARILSKFHLNNVQILSKCWPKRFLYIVQIFFEYWPNMAQTLILSKYYPDISHILTKTLSKNCPKTV